MIFHLFIDSNEVVSRPSGGGGGVVLKLQMEVFRKKLAQFRSKDFRRVIRSKFTISTWLIAKKNGTIIVSFEDEVNKLDESNTGALQFILYIDQYGRLACDRCFKTLGVGQTRSLAVTDGLWHHVAFVKDELDGTFYIDGEAVGFIAVQSTRHTIKSICIAFSCHEPYNHSFVYSGIFEDFTVYDIALKAPQVRNLASKRPKTLLDEDYALFIANIQSIIGDRLLPSAPLEYVLHNYSIAEDDLMLEFGVYNGSSITRTGNRYPNRVVYGFDSFIGLPETWKIWYKPGSFTVNGILPTVPRNVQLIKGWFNETIAPFVKRIKSSFRNNKIIKIGLLHVDCDLYSSTRTVFTELDEYIVPGTIIVFDELIGYNEYEDGEMKAFYELVKRRNFTFEVIGNKGESVAVIIKS